MTKEQERKLAEIGAQIAELFPDIYGSVRFNLSPNRKDVNINIEYSMILKPKCIHKKKEI